MEVAKYLSFSLDLFEELQCLSEDEQNAVRNCVVEATIDVLQSSVFYSSLHGRVLLCEEDVELGVLQYIRAQEHKKWWCTKGPWRQLNLLTEEDCTFGLKEEPPVVPAQQAAADDVGDEEGEDVDDEVGQDEDDDEDEEGAEDGDEDQPVDEGEQQNNAEDADVPQVEVETPPHAFDEEVGPEEGEQLVEGAGADALQTEGDTEQAPPPLQEPAYTVAAAADPGPATPVEAAVTELAPAPGSVAAEHTIAQQPADAEPPVPEPEEPAEPGLPEPMTVEGVEEIPGIANVVQQVVQAALALQTAEQALQAAQQALQAETPAAGPTNAPGGAAASAADAAAEDSSSEWSAGQGYDSDSDSDFSGNTEGTYDSDCWEMDSDDGENEDDGESENAEHGNSDAASASDLIDTGGVISGAAASGTSASAADVSQQAAGELLVQYLPSSAPGATSPSNPAASLPEENIDATAEAAAATQVAPVAPQSESVGAEAPPSQAPAPEPPALSSDLPSSAVSAAADAQGPASLGAPSTPAAAPADDPDATAASWLEIADQIRALDTPPHWIPILSSADVAAVLWDELLLQCDWHTWFFRDMIEQVRSQMPGAAQGSAGYYVPLGAGLEPQFGFDRIVTIDSVVVLMPLLNFVFWNAVLAVRGDARSVFALPLWGRRWAFVDLLRELKLGLPGIPITVSSNTSSSACGSEDRDQGDHSGDCDKSDEALVAPVPSVAQGGLHMGGADASEGECEEEHAESTCAARDVRSSSQIASDAIQVAPPLYVAAEAAHTAAPGASSQTGGSSPSSVGDGAKKGSARAATALLPMMAVFCEPFLCAAIAAYLM